MIIIFKKIIAIILCIVLGGGIYYAYKTYTASEAQKAAQLRQISAQIPPLEEKINELTAQRDEVSDKLESQIETSLTTEFLFLECPTTLYTEAFQAMKEADLSGIIGLSYTEFFKNAGKINYSMYTEMMNNGWSSCIVWDGETDLSVYITQIQNNLSIHGIAPLTAVYFPDKTYSTEYDPVLEELGITVVIHHGEEELPISPVGADEGLWHIGSEFGTYNNVVGGADDNVKAGGNRVYTVSFSGFDDKFNLANFRNMLKQLKVYFENGTMRVVDLESAYTIQRDATVKYENTIPTLEKQLAEIEEELAQTRAELEEVYAKWNNR